MKRKECFVIGALLLMLGSLPAWPQAQTGGRSGVVMLNKMEPAPNLQIVFTSRTTGKEYKTKTDKKGEFLLTGLQIDDYNLTVLAANGDVLYVNEAMVHVRGASSIELDVIDLSNPEASKGRAGTAVDTKNLATAKMTKEQQKADAAKVKADNEKIASMNEFIAKYQAAVQAQNWPDAAKALKQLLAIIPDTTRWEFYKALGDAQGHNNELKEAIQTYDKGIQIAQEIVSGTAPKDPRNPNPDPARARAGIGQMLIAAGNAYVKLDKPEMATPLFQQATQDNPNPGLAYYNLCAVEFNASKMDEAIAACERSIAADPTRAEAWFLKGAALYKTGPTPDSKGATVEALNKYLQLDPQGQHASEAKLILQTVGQQ